MKTLIERIEEELAPAFSACGYDESLAKVVLSNRPDLCEYQCNGAMAGAKKYHKAPIMIAEAAAEKLSDSPLFSRVDAVKPGFLNLTLDPAFAASYLREMAADASLGVEPFGAGKTMVLDYGGPNVAKPLHVGHLRSAVIGESLKRLYRYTGHNVLADVHLGDWGLQMGLIIEETRRRRPELPYFQDHFSGEYPSEAPFTISDLEEIYPTASARSKKDPEFARAAHDATVRLQQGDPGYTALFSHILNVSVEDLKKNYQKLDVSFDLWYGESDAQKYIPPMIERLKERNLLHESQGAMVVDVAEESDTREVPPCIIQKSDGASLYATTDLATLWQREADFHPDGILYIVDKRQDMHFTQVFRTARKAGIIRPETSLTFLGFGTMNGRDGKPFKTREGGVMRLEHLIGDISDAVYERIMQNRTMEEAEAKEISRIVGLAAIKYGDLSNQAAKNYVFDIDRFISFEGNTGPYILYTIVRIKSILRKYTEQFGQDVRSAGEAAVPSRIRAAGDDSEKALQLLLARVNETIAGSCADIAPHRLCQYIYEVSNAFNSFYHDHRILAEEDTARRESWIDLLGLTRRILETCIDLLGFSAPDQM